MIEVAILSGLAGIVIGHILTRLRDLRRNMDRLPRIESKLDALIAHAGAHFDPLDGVDPSVAEALARRKKILAIQHYREATGAGLKEAKEAVEDIQRRMLREH